MLNDRLEDDVDVFDDQGKVTIFLYILYMFVLKSLLIQFKCFFFIYRLIKTEEQLAEELAAKEARSRADVLAMVKHI